MKTHLTLLILISIRMNGAFSQGFINPGFESANLSGYGPGLVPATDAIPGWTAYLNAAPLQNIYYDVGAVTTTNGVYIYNSAKYGNYGLEGSYYVYLQGTANEPASIGQTVTIPASAQYLTWWGANLNNLSFNGQALTFSRIGIETHYGIFAADVSAFAGQTGAVLFTSASSPSVGGGLIDNIQFSSVPEPSSSLLLLLGSGVLLYARRVCRTIVWRHLPRAGSEQQHDAVDQRRSSGHHERLGILGLHH